MTQAWANNQWQTYTYDGNGRRVRRNVYGRETWQVYGIGGELLAEYAAYASPTQPQREYGYRGGRMLVSAAGQSCGVGYQGAKTWGATNGSIVNFVPTRDRDPFVEAFLNTPVARFDPGKWTSIFQVRDAIGDIPEAKRMLEANRKTLYKYGDYVKYPSIYAKKDVDLSISHTTVRGVLNRVIRESEHNLWSIGWARGDRDALSIRF